MSGWHIKNNVMRTVEILDVKPENSYVKTIFFRDEMCASVEPGQFIMVWIPGVDEIPLSISSVYPDGFSSVTVAEVGEATRALTRMHAGDVIGIRGPFGSGFKVSGERALVVGGGTGMAPLMLLINRLVEGGVKVTVIEGAENSNKLIFLDRLNNLSKSMRVEALFTTEDGSCGFRGLATELAERMLRDRRFDVIYTCGPERMIRKTYEMAKAYSVDFQASLERYVRCAIGICGSCTLGRYRVCSDGPVFTMERIREVEGYLGVLKYSESGKRIPV